MHQMQQSKGLQDEVESPGLLLMITCDMCHNRQHAICYCMLLSDEKRSRVWLAKNKHICRNCSEQAVEAGKEPTDYDILQLLDDRQVQVGLL